MTKVSLYISIIITLFTQTVFAQKVHDFSDEAVIERLRTDIQTLASEEMEGREAGTAGEQKAAAYIKMQMQEIGLQPMFDGSYYQEFPFPGEWDWGDNNYFLYFDATFAHGVDYFVLPGSESGTYNLPFVNVGFGITGMTNYAGFEDYCDYSEHDDLEGRIFVIDFYLPEALDTIVNIGVFPMTLQKIRTAEEKGAAGVIFVNTLSNRDDPAIDLRITRVSFNMPVIFAEKQVLDQLMANPEGKINLTTDIFRKEYSGINVAGYIDTGSESTVVIGGHYDHIGFGGLSSRSPGLHAIHYGADDNASGTAGVLEIARFLTNTTYDLNYNYLFIAFSGEEKGLIGSRYFTESDAYDMEKINYMFNLDMIGRMEDNTLTTIGTGSSPSWDTLIDELAPDHFNIRKNSGGRGGSDHTSFYVKDIPVIFFFTGIHDDYHKPTDTADKIKYRETKEVVAFIQDMVVALDKMDRLEFSSAPAPATSRRHAESVTLGIMPDHAFDGEGLKILSVSEGQRAYNAGIKNGDVIIKIGDTEIIEIYTYMEALGSLRRGTTTFVVVLRDGEELEIEVEL